MTDTFFGIIGDSGLRRSGGLLLEERNPRLSGSKRFLVYREMLDQNAIVAAAHFLLEVLIGQVSWKYVAADASPEAEFWRDFAESARKDIETGWSEIISGSVLAMFFGFAHWEKVYKIRRGDDPRSEFRSDFADGLLGLRDLATRSQESTDSWDFDDNGRPLAWTQRLDFPAKRAGTQKIPFEKLFRFVPRSFKGSPEGRPLCRVIEREWYMIKNFQEIEGIGIERDLAGLPVVQVPPHITSVNATDEERAMYLAAKEMVRRIRRNEYEGVVIPAEDQDNMKTGWKLSLLSTAGSRAIDPNIAITRYEKRIAVALMAEILVIGLDKHGSYAFSDNVTDILGLACAAIVDRFGEQYDAQVTNDLMRLNGAPRALWPRLSHGDIEQVDWTKISTALATLKNSGLLTDAMAQAISTQTGVPVEGVEEQEEEIDEQAAPAAVGDRDADDVVPEIRSLATDADLDVDAAQAALTSEVALNGAQVASAKDIILDVAGRRLPRETGLAMLASFFGLSAEQAEEIMGPVGESFFILDDPEAPPRSLRGLT